MSMGSNKAFSHIVLCLVVAIALSCVFMLAYAIHMITCSSTADSSAESTEIETEEEDAPTVFRALNWNEEEYDDGTPANT